MRFSLDGPPRWGPSAFSGPNASPSVRRQTTASILAGFKQNVEPPSRPVTGRDVTEPASSVTHRGQTGRNGAAPRSGQEHLDPRHRKAPGSHNRPQGLLARGEHRGTIAFGL